MSIGLRTVGVLLLSLLFVISAFAFDSQKVMITSEGLVTDQQGAQEWQNELDRTWPDSILYVSPTDYSGLIVVQNYWSGVRFTAPADFQLQGVRFLPLNQSNNVNSPCEVYVYSNNAGRPGQNLNGNEPVWTGTLPQFGPWADNWIEVDFDADGVDFIDVAEGEDFWIIYGPAPGGAYPGQNGSGYWCLYDSEASPGARSGYSTGAIDAAYTPTAGDLFIIAEGEVAEFVDVKAVSVFNDIQLFHISTADEVALSAKFLNNGNLDSGEGTVNFLIEDSQGTVLLDQDVTIASFTAGDTITVDCPVTWTPLFTDHHIVTASVSLDGDADPANNSTKLLQAVVDNGSWYAYDDGELENGTGFQEGSGWAVDYRAIDYPAVIDSASWFFGSDDETANLQVWSAVGPRGQLTITQLWTNENGPVTGDAWNSFAVNDAENPEGFSLQEGGFVVMYVWGADDSAYPYDDSAPKSASNPDMPDASYQIADFGESWFYDNSGNWGMRARLGQGVAPEINFPNNDFDFEMVNIGDTGQVYFVVENNGDGPARIDSLRLGLPGELTTDVEFPFVVNPMSMDSLAIMWTPTEEGPIGGQGTVAALVYHNDINLDSPFIVRLHGNAEVSVREIADSGIPSEFFLNQNFPNPFNPVTGIRFGLKEQGNVTLNVFDVLGRQVATLVNEQLNAGVHEATFDASLLPSGIYYYAIEVNGFTSMKKMVLMK
ncbi:T9SS type A sorting domain-containing protein [bacterium]|nr:T9SS type A sorting domain-containing protein [bacterium]